MKMNKVGIFAVLLCIVSVLSMLSMTASGEVPVDKQKKCSLKTVFASAEIKASGVKFEAYKVASVTSSYGFITEPEFAQQGIEELLENPDEESFITAASTLSGIIASDRTIEPDSTAITDLSGIALFENLDTGLYLIKGDMYSTAEAYYKPQKFMVTLPERTEDGMWNYDITAKVKWEKLVKNSKIKLKALKIWDDSATNFHTNDNVTVMLYQNDKLYDTQILNKENDWSYEWRNLYGGAVWEIKEENVEGYLSKVERNEDGFIITNTPKKPTKKPPVIPQTGLLQWPVPVLAAGGILFILIGIYLKQKGEK